MLMAHDVGFHLPWLSSRTESATQLFLVELPNIVTKAHTACLSLPEATHLHTELNHLYNSCFETLVDLDEQLAPSNPPYVIAQLKSNLRKSLSKLIEAPSERLPLKSLSAFLLFSVSISHQLTRLTQDLTLPFNPVADHLQIAQKNAIPFALQQHHNRHKRRPRNTTPQHNPKKQGLHTILIYHLFLKLQY